MSAALALARPAPERERRPRSCPEVVAWGGLATSIQGLTGVEHAGVLGGAAFQGRVVEIDYPALRLRIRPGG